MLALQHLKQSLTLGLPGMVMLPLEWSSFEIMAAFVSRLPTASWPSASTRNVSTLTFNVFLGIAVAGNIRVGHFVGRNQPKHAKLAATLAMYVAVAASASLAVLLLRAASCPPRSSTTA